VRDVTPAQIARFSEKLAGNIAADLEIQSTRVYPHGSTAAHVLGYLRRDNQPADDEEQDYYYRLPDFRGVVGTIAPEGTMPAQTAGAPADTPGAPRDAASAQAPASPQASAGGPASFQSSEVLRSRRSSPLVRRIASEHGVDIGEIPGSGAAGRVTKRDILQYLATPRSHAASTSAPPHLRTPGSTPAPSRIEIRPLSVMRRKIADHMVLSRRTSAHVHSVFHVNFTTVERIRQQKKSEYERQGAKLTYLVFIARAITDALRRHPLINASLDGHDILYKKDINLGVAVALEGGLIVPVVRNADGKSLLELSGAIADLAARARAKQLKPEEVQDGTFTITNPGQYGAQFGMPIINQPQVAILGVGTIEKRPVVVNDAIGIRLMAYLTLGYDHRLIDGTTADQFMADVRDRIEQFDIGQA
jgi:2-oxoglutarate dehydrogenase E2 component (dihydrolipoamide succinyltransferase)